MDVIETETLPEARRSRVKLVAGLVLVIALGMWVGWRAIHPPSGKSSPAATTASARRTPRTIVVLPGPFPTETPRPVPSIDPTQAQRAIAALVRQVPDAETTSSEVVMGSPYVATGELAELDIASKAGTRVVHLLCVGTGAVTVNVNPDVHLTVACTAVPSRNVTVTVSTAIDAIVFTYECRDGTLGALAYRVSRS